MASIKNRRAARVDAPDWADVVSVRAVRLGDMIFTRMTALLSEFGITPLQYNVLRILYVRDAAGEGLPIGVIGGALVTATPDVSRLIDRLEKLGCIERVRKAEDRRVVNVRLTEEGIALQERIHGPVIAHHNAILAQIPKADLERIAGDLARVLEQFAAVQ